MGYVNKKFVNRIHGNVSFVLHTLLLGLILFSIRFPHWELLKFVLILLPLIFAFDTFMQWKYPVQKNEYKKTAGHLLIVLIFAPIAYVVLRMYKKLSPNMERIHERAVF